MHGVSIVVCCHNSSKRLPETLQHLKDQQVPVTIPWEVIIIDNTSTDRTDQTALDLWSNFSGSPLRIISEPKLGLSNARIRGFQEAKYEYVSFVDDDNWVDSNWVKTVYELMTAHPEVGACGGIIQAAFEVPPPKWFHQFYGSFAIGAQAKDEGEINDFQSGLWGAGLTVRKSAWTQINNSEWEFLLSDRKGTSLSGGGDTEICYWLRFWHWRLYYSPFLKLSHFMPETRLRWEYLIRNSKGSGFSKMVLKLYKKEYLRDKNLKFKKGLGYRQWVLNLISYFPYTRSKISILRTGNIEGNPDYLAALSSNSIFYALLRCGPIKYNKLLCQIRTMHLSNKQ